MEWTRMSGWRWKEGREELTSVKRSCLPGSVSTASVRIRHSSHPLAVYNLAGEASGE